MEDCWGGRNPAGPREADPRARRSGPTWRVRSGTMTRMQQAGRRIAIVGGGAAGLLAAWLLDERHEVTLFEAAPAVGGNVVTLGGNVACPSLPPELRLEAGVVEFDRIHFPRFHALMSALDVEMRPVPISTGLFLADGSSWHSPDRLVREYRNPIHRALVKLRHLPLAQARRRFLARTTGLGEADLVRHRLEDFLADDIFGTWVRLLMTYGYSISFARVGDMGAAIAVPTLRRFLSSSEWTSIVGGTSTYLERLLSRLRGTVHTSAPVVRVDRGEDGVRVTVAGQEPVRFDVVVLAVTPERILSLLVDPDPDERRRFGAWQTNEARTLVHTDTALYERRGVRYRSEFDLFVDARGRGGYNAYLNRLCGIPETSGVHYGLALGLEAEIEPSRVLHEQTHFTPSYGLEALRYRQEVRETNGSRRTWYAGAWLGDGLHEGAVRSAEAVAAALGGRRLASGEGVSARAAAG